MLHQLLRLPSHRRPPYLAAAPDRGRRRCLVCITLRTHIVHDLLGLPLELGGATPAARVPGHQPPRLFRRAPLPPARGLADAWHLEVARLRHRMTRRRRRRRRSRRRRSRLAGFCRGRPQARHHAALLAAARAMIFVIRDAGHAARAGRMMRVRGPPSACSASSAARMSVDRG